MTVRSEILHATCVEAAGRGLLILGPSGSGKSALALQLLGMGARLVADDGCMVRAEGGALIASAPDSIAGRIEARGMGILTLPQSALCAQVPLHLAVDLSREETARLPEPQHRTILGHPLPCVAAVRGPQFAPALLFSLHGGLNLPS
jgi:HPr kinase/phosphorylase